MRLVYVVCRNWHLGLYISVTGGAVGGRCSNEACIGLFRQGFCIAPCEYSSLCVCALAFVWRASVLLHRALCSMLAMSALSGRGSDLLQQQAQAADALQASVCVVVSVGVRPLRSTYIAHMRT